MTILELKAPFHGEKQENGVKFSLVSELLGTVFTHQDEEILVEVKSQNFIYDRGQGLETRQALEVEIGRQKVEETDQEIEIRLSGIVKNNLFQETTFTLYFFMWWDYRIFPTSLKADNFGEKTGAKSLTIKATNNKEHLSDTVFELNIYRKALFERHQFLGHGRGYLVFSRET